MGDYHIRMQFDVAAGVDAVRNRLADAEGLATWWSDRVAGDAGSEGGEFKVWFPDRGEPFELRVLTHQPDRIEWHVAETPEWWAGTTIRFDLDESDGGTTLLFEHRDFEPGHPVVPIVTPAWAQIMIRLSEVARNGTSNPFFTAVE